MPEPAQPPHQPQPHGQPKAQQQRQLMSLDQAIARAIEHFSARRYREAESVCRQILGARPDTATAYNLLGATLHELGRSDEGAAAIRQAIRVEPTTAMFYANLGEVERRRGLLDAAAEALRRAVELDPRSAQAHNNRGIVFFEQKDFEAAATSYGEALRLQPDYPEAHNNLGNALRALDRRDDALEEYEAAIAQREGYAEAYNNMATVLREQEREDEAEFSYNRAIMLRPGYTEAQNNLAILLIHQERHEDALRVLGEALKTAPRHPATLVNVARAQAARHSFGMAEEATRQALAADPANVDALVVLGQICLDLDRFDEAEAALRRAVEIRPDAVDALNFLGIVLKSKGKLEEAKAVFLQALEIQPMAPGTYSNLSDLQKYSRDDPLFAQLRGLYEELQDKGNDRLMPLHFALGKAYDDVGEPEQAIAHFLAGAKIKRARVDYDEAEFFGFIDDIRAVYGDGYFDRRPVPGDPTDRPIFIVGMPRSGSTLTEQILSSHPAVHGAGEIKALNHSLGQLRQRYPNLPKYPRLVEKMKPAHFTAIAEAYLRELARLSPGAGRVTDKLLSNYIFVGLIQTLFPNAKIVHTRRNPIDTCLSAFSKLFKDDMPHSYDLGELGRYYRRYEALMEHWHRVLPPGVLFDVRYEEMVAEPERRARDLVAFLGLEWDDRCLAFHESTRPVKTASVSQVRRPLYSSSVDRWRRYGDRLRPLIEALAGSPDLPADAA